MKAAVRAACSPTASEKWAWILDRSESDLHTRFIQTEGLDFTNPNNYRPTGFLSHNDRGTDNSVNDVRGNARYDLPTPFSSFLKTGFQRRQQNVKQFAYLRRWSYLGTTALPADPSIVTFDQVHTGRQIPIWQTSTIIKDHAPVNPALWNEDLYFHEQNLYTGNKDVTETVTSGYLMTQGKWGRTGFLAGVRVEDTDVEGEGWVRARTPSSVGAQVADPVGTAKKDYANTFRVLEGGYTKAFPSAHVTHEVTRNLKARASWSMSFGRPNMSNFLPNEVINENTQTLTVSNPSLLPQVAKNWDASLEYYFEPVGSLSAGWFHKTIRDYIVNGIDVGVVQDGVDNGYDGEYVGFTQRSSRNAGTAVVQGWEFSYQQQFSFLPGLLKGLSTMVSYTILDTHGDFGGTTNLSTGQIAGFRPRTANFSLFWRYLGLSAQVLVNYQGSYLATYSAATPIRNIYQLKRTIVNLGLAYRVRPNVSLTCNVSNLFKEPQQFYIGLPERVQWSNFSGTTITLGVGGQF